MLRKFIGHETWGHRSHSFSSGRPADREVAPALVVAIAPGRHRDRLLALISSQINQTIPKFDEVIDPADPDYVATGLKVRSVVRLGRLASVETSVINARLGNIPSDRLQQIRKRLSGWLMNS